MHLGDIDTSLITDMSELFHSSERKDFSGIESWDVSNVTNMREMFFNAFYFNQELTLWDTRKVENMEAMFSYAKTFNQPLEMWDVSNVRNMNFMFGGAESFN